MTGFEPQTFGDGWDHSANRATNTTTVSICFIGFIFTIQLAYKHCLCCWSSLTACSPSTLMI